MLLFSHKNNPCHLGDQSRPMLQRVIGQGGFLIWLYAVLLGGMSLPAYPNSDRLDEGVAMINNLVSSIQDIAEQQSSTIEVHDQTNQIIDQYFDYESVASFTIGPYWRKATPEQKQNYLKTFREVLIVQVANNFDYFRTLEYRHVSAANKGEDWIIIDGIIHDTTNTYPDAQIAWRIRNIAGKPLTIFDLSVENVSMLITQKDEHMGIIRQNAGNIDALIDLLSERSHELRMARNNSES